MVAIAQLKICLSKTYLPVMSKDETVTDVDFDVRLWLCELRISEPGLLKISKNEISDEKCLLQLTPADIVDLKLGVVWWMDWIF